MHNAKLERVYRKRFYIKLKIKQTLEEASSRVCCFTYDHACVWDPNREVLHLICVTLLRQSKRQFGNLHELMDVLVNKQLMAKKRSVRNGRELYNATPNEKNLKGRRVTCKVMKTNNPIGEGRRQGARLMLWTIANRIKRYFPILHWCSYPAVRPKSYKIKRGKDDSSRLHFRISWMTSNFSRREHANGVLANHIDATEGSVSGVLMWSARA